MGSGSETVIMCTLSMQAVNELSRHQIGQRAAGRAGGGQVDRLRNRGQRSRQQEKKDLCRCDQKVVHIEFIFPSSSISGVEQYELLRRGGTTNDLSRDTLSKFSI